MKLLSFYVLCTVINVTIGQVIRPGTCRELPVVTNLDVEKFQGVWYQYMRYDNPNEAEQGCNTVDLTLSDDKSHFEIFISANKLKTREHIFATGKGIVSFPDESPVRGFINVTVDGKSESKIYQIVTIDYEDYAVLWNCQNTDDGSSVEYVWVIVRGYSVESDDGIVDGIIEEYLEAEKLFQTFQEQMYCNGGSIEGF